jgi:hypothetical protein
MRPSSEGAPESTLEMEPGSTHLPLLWSVVDFCLLLGFRFASPQAEILLTLRVSIRIIFAPFGLSRHSGLSPMGLSPIWLSPIWNLSGIRACPHLAVPFLLVFAGTGAFPLAGASVPLLEL